VAKLFGSLAERVKALFKGNCVIMIAWWINFHPRRTTMIISAWWLRTSSKFSVMKSKIQPKTRKWRTPKQIGFVQNVAPPSLSRDKKIKMTNKQTNKKLIWIFGWCEEVCLPGRSYIAFARRKLHDNIAVSIDQGSIPWSSLTKIL